MNHKIINYRLRQNISGIFFWTWIGVILFLSLMPQTQNGTSGGEPPVIRTDYLAHFAVFCFLGILFYLWKTDKNFNIKTSFIIIFFIAGFLFAGLSEYVQNYLPTRSCNPNDFIANSLGLLLGFAGSYLFFPFFFGVLNKIIKNRHKINKRLNIQTSYQPYKHT